MPRYPVELTFFAVCIGSVYVRDGNGQVLAYVYCEDEPSSLFMAGEEALPMLDLEPEENWLRCECAAAHHSPLC